MASINTIININIIKGTQAVSTQSFSVPCIFGPSARFLDTIRYYTDVNDMVSDGFLTSDPEYIYASALSSQEESPPQWGVSHSSDSVAQVDTIAVNTISSSHAYVFHLNGSTISYTASGSDTQQSILTALNAAIASAFPTSSPVIGVVTGTGSSALLTLTSSVPGIGVNYTSVDADLTHVALTPNHTMVSDIQATQAVDDSWYGVLVCTHASNDIEQIAAYIETQVKLYGASSSDSNILTSSTSDLASVLHGKGYTRTYPLYSSTPSSGPEAAWMGGLFPKTPGAANWNFKPLVSISADNLTQTQINNALGKKCNVYIPMGGVNIATRGLVSSGEYIDVTVLIDWLKANIQSAVYSVLVNTDKVPYTNRGIALIQNQVAGVLQIAQNNGGIASGWTVSAPDVSTVSTADKTGRVLNNIGFFAQLAGAINEVNILGIISV